MLSLCIFSRIFAIFFDASFPGKKFAVWRSAFVRYVVDCAIDSQASPYLFEQSSENHNSSLWICKRHAHVAGCSQGKWLLYTKTNLPSPPTPVAQAPRMIVNRFHSFVLLDSSAQSFSSMYCFRFSNLHVCYLPYLLISDYLCQVIVDEFSLNMLTSWSSRE